VRLPHLKGLANAVLRRVAAEGVALLGDRDPARLNTPAWLWDSWTASYGEAATRAIAAAHLNEAPLDLTPRSDALFWAGQLDAELLPSGTLRRASGGIVSELPGFAEGAWWVQDAAAALPARLLGDVRGKTVADLCAAPGGKTAQLAQAGAHVVAVDRTDARLVRLRQNLARLKLTAETVVADATQWQGGPFDAVLLDAPCSSTGTIRRHPDIPWLKREDDIATLTTLQRSLLARAVELVKPGGPLVYCTCSLEPEECEAIVTDLLTRDSRLRRCPVTGADVGGRDEFLTANGDLRTLPCHLPDATPQLGGMDGFYAARLERL